jgi:hypothetical protein
MKKNLVILLLTLAGFITAKGQHAILDLSSWDPLKKSIIPLDGEWEFYHNVFLDPAAFKDSSAIRPDLLVHPGSWNDIHLNAISISSTGFATYHLTLRNVPKGEFLLDIYSIQTSSRIFVNDSLVAQAGVPGKDKEHTVPATKDLQVALHGGQGDVSLTVQVANFHHRKGGFVHAIELGTADAVNRQRILYYGLDLVESTALAILGLFLFMLYVFRRKDLSVLYFALFCLTLSFRPVISVNYFMAYVFPGINWSFMLKLEYLSVLFPCLFMLLFIKKLFPLQLSSLFVKVFSVILLLKIAVVLLFPPIVFSWIVLPLLFVITIGVLVFAVTIIRAVLAKVEGANYAGIGIMILLVSLLFKVLVYAGIFPPVHVLITLLDIAFIFTMSLILGSRFSLQFVQVETLQIKTHIQHQEIERKKEILEDKNKEILDSIIYAKRIQQALLPTEKYIEREMKKRDTPPPGK